MSEFNLIDKENEFWEGVSLNEPIVHIQRCEDAAKSLITVTTILAAIFTGVIASSDAYKALVGNYLLLLFLSPLGLWLASLFLATDVIVPRKYTHSAEATIKKQYEQIRLVKHRALRWGYGLLIASMIFLFSEGVYFLVVAPRAVPQP